MTYNYIIVLCLFCVSIFAALQQRQQRKKVEKEQKKKKKLSSSKQPPQGEETAPAEPATESPSLPPPSRPPPLSLKQSFVAGTEIPVFTNLFLLHNRGNYRSLRHSTRPPPRGEVRGRCPYVVVRTCRNYALLFLNLV